MYTAGKSNVIEIVGRVSSEVNFSHEAYGEKFYNFFIVVNRESDFFDELLVTVSQRFLIGLEIVIGTTVCISGQIRSYNVFKNGKSRLMLTLFVREMNIADDKMPNYNKAVLFGNICRPVNYRKTPLGREISDLLIAVNRSYGKSDYIPCIAWGKNARYAKNMSIGDKVYITGRLQSRDYMKVIDDKSEKHTTYELSASGLELINNI